MTFWHKYGPDLDCDLLDLGINVRRCFGPPHRDRLDWRTVWRRKDRLPKGSLYKSALLMDEELAEQIVSQEPDDADMAETALSPQGWTDSTYLLAAAVDRLGNNIAAVIAAAGADPPRIQPMPRPVTAIDAARERKRLASMSNLIDMFTPRPGVNTTQCTTTE